MNIFEQYGIKEVADVTLYAIELDKYDDEVYVPVMYLDTLKVSTVEQTAEQTSAKGGLGNPDLIVWDYGKEISVTLEDALYTPASQSLMWGGRFGTKNSKVYGVWNPFVYPKDINGRTIYLKRASVEYPKEAYELTDKSEFHAAIKEWVESEEFQNFTSEVLPGYVATYLDSNEVEVSNEETGDKRYIPVSNASNFQSSFNSIYNYPKKIYCPCDEKYMYIKFIETKGSYKYLHDTDNYDKDQLFPSSTQCPFGKIVYEDEEGTNPVALYLTDGSKEISGVIKYNYAADPDYALFKGWDSDGSIKTDDSYQIERAYLTIDNYGKFNFKEYIYYPIKNKDGSCYYKEIPVCDSINSYPTNGCTGSPDVFGYFWENSDISMISLDGEQDRYYIENADIRYRVDATGTNKQIMIARELLKQRDGQAPTDTDEHILADEVLSYEPEDQRYYKEDTPTERTYTNLLYQVDDYGSKVNFYKDITFEIVSEDGTDAVEKQTVRVLVGTFYIISDWNVGNATPEEMIHPINSGLADVKVLDRMEKCKATQTFAIDCARNIRMNNYREMPAYANSELAVYIDPKTMKPFEPNSDHYTKKNGDIVEGSLRIIKQYDVYYKWTRSVAPDYSTLGHQIIVDAVHFPGTYKLVGETYARSRDDGKDQRFQIEIPLCKMSSETSLTLEAAGDPTTFTMNLKVLRKEDGTMIKLTQYDVENNKYDGYTSGSTRVVPSDGVIQEDPFIE